MPYSVEFPDPANCSAAPPPGGKGPGSTVVRIETGGTALDVMTAAADKNSDFNFVTTYFSDTGYFVNAVRGTPSTVPSGVNCYWGFYYTIPGVPGEIFSSVGVSDLIIPSDGWHIILRYIPF